MTERERRRPAMTFSQGEGKNTNFFCNYYTPDERKDNKTTHKAKKNEELKMKCVECISFGVNKSINNGLITKTNIIFL